MHLSEIVRRQAAARPGDPSYSCAETDLTWRQTDERTSRLAAALYARGLRPGERVAILARACHRYWEVHFGCAKAGLVVVPVNHRLQAAEVKHILSDVGAKAAVVDARLADVAAAADIPLRLGFGHGHGQPLDYEAMLAEHEPVPPAVELRRRGPQRHRVHERHDRDREGRHAHASRIGALRLRIRDGQPVPQRRRGADVHAALRLCVASPPACHPRWPALTW